MHFKKARTFASVIALTTGFAGVGVVTAGTASAQVNKCNSHPMTFNAGGSAGILNVNGGTAGSGAKVVTWYWNNESNEYWCLEKAAEGGWYLHPSYDTDLCMAVPAGRYFDGAGIIIWSCNGHLSQRWRVQPTSSGTVIQPMGDLNMGLADMGAGSQVEIINGGGNFWS